LARKPILKQHFGKRKSLIVSDLALARRAPAP